MGFLLSKSKKEMPTDVSIETSRQGKNSRKLTIIVPEQVDNDIIETLKDEFRDNIETFILNQLLMSFMFFDDYKSVIKKCLKRKAEKKISGYDQLITEHEKELLFPDIILNKTCKRVKITESADEKYKSFARQRLFILHNNIDVQQNKHYSKINRNDYYQTEMKSTKNKGFVTVNLTEPPGTPNQKATNSHTPNSISEKDEEMNNKSNDSGSNTESDYEYSTITAHKTPKDIGVLQPNLYTFKTQLPNECIQEMKNVADQEDETEQENDGQSPENKLKKYINSRNFMEHFKSVFQNHLSKMLGFTQSKLQAIPGAIYCDLPKDDTIIQYEILPAITIIWPDDIAFEWPVRGRNTVLEEIGGGKMAYRWPTIKMIDEIRELNCLLIPKGFVPKRGNNLNKDIEWEICFPKAERYLELKMIHAQTRSFLYIITLFKTHIEPHTATHGLLIEHLRHHMFWECENNYRDWPEHKLGTKILLILKNLYTNLSQQNLPHYFIRERNVLKNIPSMYIMKTLEIFQEIFHSPLLSFISTLKHLCYNTNTQYYPLPNLEELYDIITAESAFPDSLQKFKTRERGKIETSSAKNKNNAKEKLNKEEANSSQTYPNPQPEDVPIKMRFDKDNMRKNKLLTYFIQIFLDIASVSHEISSTNQTLLYLKHSWYLTKVLEEFNLIGATEFQKHIAKEEKQAQIKKAKEPTIPKIPKRNTVEVKGKEINMENLSKSYNDTVQSKTKYVRNKTKPKKNISFDPVVVETRLQLDNTTEITSL